MHNRYARIFTRYRTIKLYRKFLISIGCYLLCCAWCNGQSVALPDTLFNASFGVADNKVDVPQQEPPHFTFDYIDRSFRLAPVTSWDELSEMPWSSQPLFSDLPEVSSQFFVHVLLLYLSKVKIEGLDEYMAWYNMMLQNFNRGLYDNLVSSAALYSGCLDPVEAYRRWAQERRLQRAKGIIQFLEDETPAVTSSKISPSSFKLPDNLLQENNYDVKVKSDGNNPPYRP